MREHPLLMKGPLVRATLEGRKTQTRRPINPQPSDDIENVKYDDVADLWLGSNKEDNALGYCFSWTARCPLGRAGDRLWVRDRLVLPLVSVRVERVQDITEEDARAEGVEPINGSYREGFRAVWHDIYGTWDANPWVWVAEWEDIEVSR